MTKEEASARMTDVLAKFVAYTGKRLPDDVRAKIAASSRRGGSFPSM